MPVTRLSKSALMKLIEGQVKEEAQCIVQFYSNSCHLCHNLQEYYQQLADDPSYADLHFFAFNIEDAPGISERLNFNGVPTISSIVTGNGESVVKILADPMEPHKKTWYRVSEIKEFIEKGDKE